MDKLTLKPYVPENRPVFIEMLTDYLLNDQNEDFHHDRLSLIASRIEYELGVYDMRLYMLCSGDSEFVGFIWFQKDTPENPWCVKPGWGFIREMYIRHSLRGQGLGEAAAREAVEILKSLGADKIYLTAESQKSRVFWQRLGFQDSGEVCDKNGLEVFTL